MAGPNPLLTYKLEGAGSPVLLLNGGMMSIGGWEPIAATLRLHHQVLRCDFRGQLLSPGATPADVPATLSGHAADVVALLDHLAWPSVHLLGASFGAAVALELAASAPERIGSLALLTAMHHETEAFRRQGTDAREVLAGILAGGERHRFVDILFENVYSARYRQDQAPSLTHRRQQIDALPATWFTGLDRLFVALAGFDFRADFAAPPGAARRLPPPCPSLVLLAGQDQVMDPAEGRAMADALGATLAVHESAGHGLVAEDPDWVAQVYLDFLATLPS